VAVVAGVVLTGDFDREEGSEAARVATLAEEAGQDAGGEAAPEAATTTAAATDEYRVLLMEEVASVQGPPGEVARLLRRKGFTARVADGGGVVVQDTNKAAVRKALVGRPAGPVPVFVP
jgi:hypothetical protein